MFYDYLDDDDFVGAEMARKFLQMGHTRSRRYANYRGGKKYQGSVPEDRKCQSGAHGRAERSRTHDPQKAESARIFKSARDQAAADERYVAMRKRHRVTHEQES